MVFSVSASWLLVTLYIVGGIGAQSSSASASACASTIPPRHGQPSVAAGWNVQVVASGLTDPRGMVFDSEGGLLVVQQGRGIARVRFTEDEGACVRAEGNVEDVFMDEGVRFPCSSSRWEHL